MTVVPKDGVSGSSRHADHWRAMVGVGAVGYEHGMRGRASAPTEVALNRRHPLTCSRWQGTSACLQLADDLALHAGEVGGKCRAHPEQARRRAVG